MNTGLYVVGAIGLLYGLLWWLGVRELSRHERREWADPQALDALERMEPPRLPVATCDCPIWRPCEGCVRSQVLSLDERDMS